MASPLPFETSDIAFDASDIGCPLPVSTLRRLQDFNFSGIFLPYYKKGGKQKEAKNFFWIANKLKFIRFCTDLNSSNRGIILDRPTTEAAFFRVAVRYYKKLKPEDFENKFEPGKETWGTRTMFTGLMLTVSLLYTLNFACIADHTNLDVRR